MTHRMRLSWFRAGCLRAGQSLLCLAAVWLVVDSTHAAMGWLGQTAAFFAAHSRQ